MSLQGTGVHEILCKPLTDITFHHSKHQKYVKEEVWRNVDIFMKQMCHRLSQQTHDKSMTAVQHLPELSKGCLVNENSIHLIKDSPAFVSRASIPEMKQQLGATTGEATISDVTDEGKYDALADPDEELDNLCSSGGTSFPDSESSVSFYT